jgi:hypothetical protein
MTPRVRTWAFVPKETLQRLQAACAREHPDWTLDDALGVAFVNGIELLIERYEGMAQRRTQWSLEARAVHTPLVEHTGL